MFELGGAWAEDLDGDGAIDAEEITVFLKSIYPLVFQTSFFKIDQVRLI